MVFVIRVRTASGVKRLMFKDDRATWDDLQLQILDVTGIVKSSQSLSTLPPAADVSKAKSTSTLKSLKLQHGDMLQLSGEATRPATATIGGPTTSTASRTFKPGPSCTHGPRGRCLNCIEEGGTVDEADDDKNTGKRTKQCQHGPGVVCLYCSLHVGDKSEGPAEWLCNHPDTAFCPKCLPPDIEAEEKKLVNKVDKIPYKYWLNERKRMCKSRHAPGVTCMFCAEPVAPCYTGKKDCNRGHKPWPYGVCLNCAPPNALLRPQVYRHCDNISWNATLIQNFYRNWMLRDNRLQKAAIIFGYYEDEDKSEFFKEGAVKAVVQGLYEPPQEGQPTGVRFLRDPNEKNVHEVAKALGLEPIGWIVTTRPRAGKKYGGKVIMSGSEVRQAARFQERYKNELGQSRFITVVLEHQENVEPMAYQISDQGVALERDGVFAKSQDPYLMRVRTPESGELLPSVIFQNKALKSGVEFLPDDFIVKVITSVPKKTNYMFCHSDFPSNGGEGECRSHMSRFNSEDYLAKLSDFNLLCALSTTFNLPVVLKVCEAIKNKQPLGNDVKAELDTLFVQKNFF